MHIFITATTEVADDELVGRHLAGALHGVSEAVGGFERGHDTFDRAKGLERVERFGVGRITELDAAFLLVVSVLGADSSVVESSGHGVCEVDLAVVILQDPGLGALKDTELTTFKSCGMMPTFNFAATGFNASEFHIKILEEGEKDADRIRTTTDTSSDFVRQAAFFFHNLAATLFTDHTMEVAHHHWEWM